MRKEKLSSLCDIRNGFAFKSDDYINSGYKVIRITNVQKGCIVDNDPKFISKTIADKVENFKLQLGDILVSLTGNVGRVGRIQSCHLPAVLNQRVGLIRPRSVEIDERYLFQYLNSYLFEQEAIKNANGVAQLNLSSKWLENYLIPLPAPEDQKRIAYLLGKIEETIAQRKQHLQQLDNLLKSVFLEMFGDPVQNEKGWNKKPFSKILLDIESGKSPKCEVREANDGEWGVLKLGSVTNCFYKQSENKALPEDVEPQTKFEVKPGDLLFSRKNTYELVAACAYVFETRPKLLIPDLIFRFVFRDNTEVNSIFIWQLLTSSSQRKKIQSLASGAAGSMPNISKEKLKQVSLPIPPIDLQEKFAAIVEKLEIIKFRYQQSLTDLEILYGVLSQKAFKGELDLSRVPLPPDNTEATEENTATDEPQPTADTFDLPAPSDLTTLTSVEGRNALLNEWLTVWLERLNNTPFSTQSFIEAAQQRLWELAEEDALELGAADYEQIKVWTSQSLDQGRLAQTYNNAKNRVQLKAVSNR